MKNYKLDINVPVYDEADVVVIGDTICYHVLPKGELINAVKVLN